jgi:tRNA threonylcarbamoyladenosine biosynthesis protein TsaE
MRKVRIEELPAFAHEVAQSLDAARDNSRATLVALRGDLGAGKTTFVQAFARALGVEENVQSPTYVLMKKYTLPHSLFKTLIHIDAYRLEKPEEFTALRPQEFLGNPENLVVVEWPERLGGALPKPNLTLAFSSNDAGAQERYIEVI